MKKIFGILATVIMFGAGCTKTNSSIATLVTTSTAVQEVKGPVTPREPEAGDIDDLNEQYEIAVLTADGLVAKLSEIDDWIKNKNYDDATDAGLSHFAPSTGDYYVNEVPLFQGKDLPFVSTTPSIAEIHAAVQLEFDTLGHSAEYYASAIAIARVSITPDVQKNIVAARAEQTKAEQQLKKAKKLIADFKERYTLDQ